MAYGIKYSVMDIGRNTTGVTVNRTHRYLSVHDGARVHIFGHIRYFHPKMPSTCVSMWINGTYRQQGSSKFPLRDATDVVIAYGQ